MKIRKYPFGYELQMGKIQINPLEAQWVKKIYDFYLTSQSFQKTADWLNAEQISYSPMQSKWNKNTVARILQDDRYLGDRAYPSIISREKYKLTAEIIQSKKTVISNGDDGIDIPIYCRKCYRKIKKNGKNNWSCPTCKSYFKRINAEDLKNAITENLQPYYDNPNLISHPSVTKFDNIAPCLLIDSDFNEKESQNMAYRIAEERYRILDSNEYETEKIRYLFRTAEALDFIVAQSVVDKLLLDKEGNISVELINGQII